MGNEMGNNNTSGLREEDNTSPDAEGKAEQQPPHPNDLKGENHAVMTPQITDYHQKETELAFDDPREEEDTPHTQTFNGKEQEETEFPPPVESPQAEQKLNEENGKDSEFHTTASLPEELQDCESPKSSNFTGSFLEMSKHQIENLSSLKKEEGTMLNTISVAISSAHEDSAEPKSDVLETRGNHAVQSDQSPEPKSDEHEFKENQAGKSEHQNTNSPKGVEENDLLLDISESYIECNSKENGHASGNHISDNLEGTVVPKRRDYLVTEVATQKEVTLSKENFDVEVGNNDGYSLEKTISISDLVEANSGEKVKGMDSNGTNSLGQEEAHEMDDLLSSDVDVSIPEDKCIILAIGKESESADNKHYDNESDSEIDWEIASQTDSSRRLNCKNDEKGGANDAACNGNCQAEDFEKRSEGEVMMVHRHELFAAEPSIANGKISEGKIMMVPELETLPAKLPVINGTNNKKESEDVTAKEEEPAKKQIMEIKEKSEAPCATDRDIDESIRDREFMSTVAAEAYRPCSPASLLHQQKTATKCEDAQGSSESSSEMKLEISSELLATSTDVETLVSAIEKPEKVLPHLTAAAEMVTASENHSAQQHQKVETSIIEEKEDVNGSIPENLIGEDKSSFSAVQLGIEKAQAAIETVTEAKLLASANQSSEQSARVGYEEQESAGRFSTESISDYLNARAEMRKSPSFDIDLRIEARSEESDHTPLLYQNKNTVEVSLESSLVPVRYNQESPKYEVVPGEEKVITLERSDSEKSRTPFLGFLKEEEDAHVAATPKQQDRHDAARNPRNSSSSKEVTPTPSKSKEKHKRKSSLFTNCMCCTTVIH